MTDHHDWWKRRHVDHERGQILKDEWPAAREAHLDEMVDRATGRRALRMALRKFRRSVYVAVGRLRLLQAAAHGIGVVRWGFSEALFRLSIATAAADQIEAFAMKLSPPSISPEKEKQAARALNKLGMALCSWPKKAASETPSEFQTMVRDAKKAEINLTKLVTAFSNRSSVKIKIGHQIVTCTLNSVDINLGKYAVTVSAITADGEIIRNIPSTDVVEICE